MKYNTDFKELAKNAKTPAELTEAILSATKDAEAELLSNWEHITKNGLIEPTHFYWDEEELTK